MVPVQPAQQRKHAGGRDGRCAKVAFGHTRPFEFVFVRLVLRSSDDGKETTAVVGRVVSISGHVGFYFHSVVFSVSVEDEFQESKTALVIKQVVILGAHKAGMKLVEQRVQQRE